ncbi:MAG: ribosomal protein S18-alanine N-acetyltransferase [Betaproteobacteria bacterium]
MSAQLDILPLYRRMAAGDLAAVMAIEEGVYTHPWTRGNFLDSIQAGHHCWIAELRGVVVGYSVAAVAVGEAHLLNLSIAAAWQRRGLGSELLRFMLKLVRDYGAQRAFLEVRPSNTAARRLYARAGFSEIGVRRDYYPAHEGREDALVLERAIG